MEVYTVEEVAKKLKVRPRTVREWIKKGQIKASKLPSGQWRIKEEELRRILNNNERG